MQLTGPQVTLTTVAMTAVERLLPIFNSDEQFNLMSGGSPTLSLDAVKADMLEAMSMPGGMVWQISLTADLAGVPIGVAQTAFIPPPSSAWIALLIIQPALQQHGYGQEAAELLEQFFFSDPAIQHIGLAVLLQNERALRFWQQRGYQRHLKRRDSHDNPILTMRLDKRAHGTDSTA